MSARALQGGEEWRSIAPSRPFACRRSTSSYARSATAIVTGEGRPYQANKVHALLRTFFDWCAKPAIGKIKTSPMIGLDKPFDKEQPRECSFNDDEIKALWRAADKIGGSEGRFLQALLLTGKRKGALSRMSGSTSTRLGSGSHHHRRAKNKRLLPVPLSSLAQSVIGKRQSHGYVFPGPTEHTHYKDDGGSCAKRCGMRAVSLIFFPMRSGRRQRLNSPSSAFLRTFAICCSTINRSAVSGARYDHHEYGEEMREAIEAWAGYVANLVQPARERQGCK